MSPKAKKNEEITFEEAVEQLEEMIESMESGDIPLSEMVHKYEQGSQLLIKCNERLTTAQMKIVKIKQERDKLEAESFDSNDDFQLESDE